MSIAFSYIRFSSPRQATGNSLRRQLEKTMEYCARHNLRLDTDLKLRDLGISAFRGKNVREGALAGFLEACRSGQVPRGSTLIVENLDRLSRDQIRPALQLFLGLQEQGITIVTLDPERVYPPECSDALSLIEPLIIFSRGHEESSIKSMRNRDAWNQRRKLAKEGKKIRGKCPRWIKQTEKGFSLIPERAKVIELIFRLAIEGHGAMSITNHLRENNIYCFGYKKRWNTAYVTYILRSPAVYGEMQFYRYEQGNKIPDGNPIENHFPAVIDKDTFLRAQRERAIRYTRKGFRNINVAENLFTGLVTNYPSGKSMCLNKSSWSNGGSTYLQSDGYLHGEKRQEGDRFPYPPFEAGILSMVQELEFDREFRPDDSETTLQKELSDLEEELRNLDGKIIKVKNRIQHEEDTDEYLDILKGLTQKKKVTAKKIEQVSSIIRRKTVSLQETKSLIEKMAETSGEELILLRRKIRQRLRQLIENIAVLVKKPSFRRWICFAVVKLQTGEQRRVSIVFPSHRALSGFTDMLVWPDDFNGRV